MSLPNGFTNKSGLLTLAGGVEKTRSDGIVGPLEESASDNAVRSPLVAHLLRFTLWPSASSFRLSGRAEES